MIKKFSLGIGIMSGTSMDGIDACLVKIFDDFKFEIIGSESVEYPEQVREMLLQAANNNSTVSDICSLNFITAKQFAKCANQLIHKSKTKPDFIASHGQTIFHNPNPTKIGGIETSSTLQIGDISVIAQETGICTVGNFRTRDIAAGGQGAPLVPFADELIFKKNIPRAIQNIGGIGNVTVLSENCETFAFDTGPGNMLIDYAVRKLFGKPFDKGGEIALSGTVDENLLSSLMEERYYFKKPPKSTGRELFNDIYAQKILDFVQIEDADLIATLTALTSKTIACAYLSFVFPKTPIKEVVLGGGGAYNEAIKKYLKQYLPNVKIKTHSDFGIDDKLKEALAFAMLGYCTLNKIPNNIPSCTGANEKVIMGETAY